MATIKNVEILKVGTWNGEKFTADHLDAIFENFGKLDYQVPVKLGHTNDPGAPAYGWVENLKRVGDSLFADFVDVPKQIYQMIKDKQFNQVSVEVFFNLKRAGGNFLRALKAVALLGAEIPAVAGLKPVSSSLSDITGAESTVEFSVNFDAELQAFMSKHGNETVTFDLDLLKVLSSAVYHKAREGNFASVTYKLSELPDSVIQGFSTVGELGEGVEATSTAFKSLFHKYATGAFPQSEVNEMNLLVKLLSQVVAAVGDDKRDAFIAELAQAASMKPDQFREVLEGKVTELSEKQVEGLGAALAVKPPNDDGQATEAQLRQQITELQAKLDNSDATNQTVAQLSEQLKALQNENATNKIESKIKGVKIPALRNPIRAIAQLCHNRETKVKLFNQETEKLEDVSAETALDSLIATINDTAINKLFSEHAKSGDHESVSTLSASDELDQKAKEYMDKNKSKDYSAACAAVLETDSDLKQRYAEEA